MLKMSQRTTRPRLTFFHKKVLFILKVQLNRSYYVLLLGLFISHNVSYGQQQAVKPLKQNASVNSKKMGPEDNKSNITDRTTDKSNDKAIKHEPPGDLIDFRSQVKVILSDGREVTGRLSLQVPKSIHFKHSKQGIQYYKMIRIQDISHIEFKAWKSRFIKAKKMGKIYRFSVSNYTVKLTNGQILEQTGKVLPFLEELLLSNTNGNVRLYSYWIDLYNKNERWHTGMQGPVEGKRFLAHADVIKKIILFEQKSN